MPISRRTLIGIGIGAAVGGTVLSGCSAGGGPGLRRPQPSCTPRSALISRGRLGEVPLLYDISGEPTQFRFEPGFYDQLTHWLADYLELSGMPQPDRIRSFGSWTDGAGECDSWHNSGRAFDLARLLAGDEVLVSCRYDLWRDFTGGQLERVRSRYWALAASLHLHFAYVLTYLYDANHHNHIHLDNGRSGGKLSTFSTRSPSQVQAVQAMLSFVWGEPVSLTGAWDSETSAAARSVLEREGIDGSIDGSTEAWRSFLRRTTARRTD